MKRHTNSRTVKLGSSKGVKIRRIGRHVGGPMDLEGAQTHRVECERIPNARLPQQREANARARQAYLEGLPLILRHAAGRLAEDLDDLPAPSDTLSMDAEYLTSADIPQPSEPSHEGGEYFHFIDIADRKRKDGRTWHQAVSTRQLAWQDQMPALTNAYLRYKHEPPPECASAAKIYVEVIGLHEYENPREVPNHVHTDYINESLIYHGLIGSTPINPSRAFPIDTLEIYHRCRRRCPQFSIQQWVRVLCDLHNITYTPSLRDGLSDAFDTYLDILRRVDARIYEKLGWNMPGWRMRTSCPPCQYQLQGEPELEPAILGALDGNNSLKRFRRQGRPQETLEFASDYFIDRAEVEQFKDEVKRRIKKDNQLNSDLVEVDEEGDPCDGAAEIATCTERWRAALADTVKGMYDAFDESGIFISVCRHGFIWSIVDMLQSGELAKYPIAVTNKMLSVFGHSLGIGYDIGCSFAATLKLSSLADRAQQIGLKLVVPAFHGHAHNRLCAITNHVQVSKGFGLEDLETCERVFSASNAVARLTRHATRFHRHQFIDLHFRQWDEDKYENLGRFLIGNYKQATNIQRDASLELEALLSGRHVHDTQYAQWLEDERKYILSKRHEPVEDGLRIEYVDLLQKHAEAHRIWTMVQRLAGEQRPNAKESRRLMQASHDAWASVQFLQQELQRVEERLDVGERWTEASPEYQKAVEYMTVRTYQRAVDHLEGLVVQRLFELTKANEAGTGYKQRTHMAKALHVRSKAIQRALKKYNAAAAAMLPPRPTLRWQEIIEYGTLAEFELLRWGARQDIRNLDWAHTVNRQAGICHRKIQRATEEICRLNIEIRRLATSIAHEADMLPALAGQIKAIDPALGCRFEAYVAHRLRVNGELNKKLRSVMHSDGFTGDISIGQRANIVQDVAQGVPGVPRGSETTDEWMDEEFDEDDENEERDRLWDGLLRATVDND